jgi:hypothetical protein
VTAQPAAAQAPCWKQIINEWTDTGKVSPTYQLHCYGEAIARVPDDLAQYTGIIDLIQAARLQASRGVRFPTAHNPATSQPTASTPDRGVFTQAFDKLGSRNVDTVPVPLLILAALSLLLVAAGAAGLIARRLRSRSYTPPTA